jgi:hypothetical protein
MKGLTERVKKLESEASLENSSRVYIVRFVKPDGKRRELRGLRVLRSKDCDMRNDTETEREFTARVRGKYPDCRVFVEVLNDDDEAKDS